MCLSRLHQVLELGRDGTCLVRDLDGRRRRVSLLAYEGEALRAGGWVAVHSGYALGPVPAEEADAALALRSHAVGDREVRE